MPPGSRALAFAHRWFDPATVHGTFEPLVADWQREWSAAAPHQRRPVAWRGRVAFICAVIVSSPRTLGWISFPLVSNIVTGTGLFMIVATIAFSAPVLVGIGRWSMPLLCYLAATAFLVALPFSTIIGADIIRRKDDFPAYAQRNASVQIVGLIQILMVLLSAIVVPAARAYWFATDPAGATAIAGPGHPTPDEALRSSRVFAAATLLPPVLLWIRSRAPNVPQGPFTPMPTSVAAVLAMVGYIAMLFAGSFVELRYQMPRGAGGLLPLLAFAFAAVPEQWWSRVRFKAR